MPPRVHASILGLVWQCSLRDSGIFCHVEKEVSLFTRVFYPGPDPVHDQVQRSNAVVYRVIYARSEGNMAKLWTSPGERGLVSGMDIIMWHVIIEVTTQTWTVYIACTLHPKPLPPPHLVVRVRHCTIVLRSMMRNGTCTI